MRRLLLLSGLMWAGCATSSEELLHAQRHQARADQAAAYGDYHRAEHEQYKADKHRARAEEAASLGY